MSLLNINNTVTVTKTINVIEILTVTATVIVTVSNSLGDRDRTPEIREECIKASKKGGSFRV